MLPDPLVDQFDGVGGVAVTRGGTESGALQIAQAQLGVPVPLCYGYVRARGNVGPTVQLADKTQVMFILLGEGQWDGIDRLWVNRALVSPSDITRVHFHPGTDGELGHGLVPDSNGGDQRVDNFWANFPTNVPRVTFSRTAYMGLYVPPDSSAPGAGVDWLGDFRTNLCRIFDGAGNQTAYQFTTNPAWQILDLYLRMVIKREALIGAALTASEKTRFDFASFVAAAAYYDAVLAGGQKRFETSFAFPARMKFRDRLDQMLMCCRSYTQEVGRTIVLFADQPRAAGFTLTAAHIKPGSFKPLKSQLRGAVNRFIGVYNDLNVAAIATVDTIANSGAMRTANVATLKFTAAHPFRVGDQFISQNISDASFNATATISAVPDAFRISYANAGANVGAATAGGGTVGTAESKFTQRTKTINHENHQAAVGQVGVGLAPVPKINDTQFDFGNNTGERVERILRFMATRTLGPDAAPYQAPWGAQVEAWMESVDAGGNALLAQLPGDLITVDASVSDEFAGTYELLEPTDNPLSLADDSGQDSGTRLLKLQQYIASAFPDAGDGEAPVNPTVPPRALGSGTVVVNGELYVKDADHVAADGSSYQRPRIGLTLAPDSPYNGDFEQFPDSQVVADGWEKEFELGGGTYARSVSAWRGTYAQELRYTGGVTAAVMASRPISVKPGFKYTAACRAKIDATHAADGFYFRICWYNSDADFSRAAIASFTDIASGGNNNFASVGANVYKAFSGEVTAPAGARFARIAPYAYNTPAVATIITIDTVTWNNSTVDLDAVADGTRCAWDTTTQKAAAVDANGNLLLKNRTSALGSTSNPTFDTNVGTWEDIPEMSITVTTQGNPVLVLFNGQFSGPTFNNPAFDGQCRLLRDGSQVGNTVAGSFDLNSSSSYSLKVTINLNHIDTPAAGSHTYKIQFNANPGFTVTAVGTNRELEVVELG